MFTRMDLSGFKTFEEARATLAFFSGNTRPYRQLR